MHVCLCVRVHVYISVYAFVYVCAFLCHVFVCLWISACVCVCVSYHNLCIGAITSLCLCVLQVILQYLKSYPLGKKLEKHFGFFICQLNYEYEAGRMSALKMLRSIFSSFDEVGNVPVFPLDR